MGFLSLGKYKAVMVAIGLFLLFVAGVFVLNYYMARQFAADAAGVNLAGQQGTQSERIIKNLLLLENLLLAGEPIGQPLDGLKTTVNSFEGMLNGLADGGLATGPKGNAIFVEQIGTDTGQAIVREAQVTWQGYKQALSPVVAFEGEAYPDDPDAFYTPQGAQLSGDVSDAIEVGSEISPKLLSLMDRLSTHLQDEAAGRAEQLRLVQTAAIGMALLLFVVIVLYFGRKLRNEELIASEAQRETDNILETVKEGLFLLDRDMKIGTEHSKALRTIFRRSDFANMKFDRLLKDIVPEKTLAVATDFIGLLWSNRVNEKLVKTLNPLSEVEVHFEKGAGNYESHYLEFDFNRVVVDDELSHVLVTVSDITQRVLLARELEASRSQSVAQLDLLLGILHVDPTMLTTFLSDATAAMKRVNATLRESARRKTEYREKLDRIFREIHTVKGEAATLGLDTVEENAHDFENMLSELRDKSRLSGNDFLPLTVKLEELFRHLESMKDLLGRLAELRIAMAREPLEERRVPQAAATKPRAATSAQERQVRPTQEAVTMVASLKKLATRVAGDQGKQVSLECNGLDKALPEAYQRPVRDIAVQFIRNAIVHGIEEPWVRSAAHKPPSGRLALGFHTLGDDGYELTFRDDGQGLVTTNIKTSAIKKKLITPEEAAGMSSQQVMSLIFRPGFSTSQVSKDGGRGVGLDIVRSLVSRLGGKLRLSSVPGKHTQFRIELPALGKTADVA